MAKAAHLEFNKRMFSGNRLAAALEELEISQSEFLAAYNSVQTDRVKPTETIQKLQQQIAQLQARLGIAA